ncbi:putative Protein HVA22 [Capsicum annuum]|nr:putative Protein HVA22 [Capsicum annuum]
MNPIRRLSSTFPKILLINPTFSAARRRLSTKSGNDEWNDAWEAAWLPDDLSGKNRAPWETDIIFALPYDTSNTAKNTQIDPRVTEVDAETKAFVEDMNENWHLRKGKQQKSSSDNALNLNENESLLYSLENIKRDYRLKKQKVHAGLWLKEIEKMEESMLGDSIGVIGDGDDIEKLLDSCSEIFGSPNDDLSNSNMTSEFKNKPDGWETTSKTQDGNIWEMSQREEDILVQEFERRIAFNKFQVCGEIRFYKFKLAVRLGHTRGVCCSLHGRPPKNAHIAQSNTTGDQRAYLSDKEYNEYLQYQARVVDSGASDHTSGDKSLLSDIVYSQPLSSVTLDSALFVPGCLFNLASDRKTGQTIVIGHESQGLPSYLFKFLHSMLRYGSSRPYSQMFRTSESIQATKNGA